MLGFLKKVDFNKGIKEYEATPGAILLDVRTDDEYKNGHVPGSKNIDVAMIDKTPDIVNDKSTPLFVHCLSGARSSRAVSALKSMGYTNVRDIGGISSYKGPIEKGNGRV